MYTAPGASIGKGDRSDPNKFMPNWTPAPNAYDVAKDASQNNVPKTKYLLFLILYLNGMRLPWIIILDGLKIVN